MSVNRARPHLYVLPEDGANRQIANGFRENTDSIGQMQVLREARGWNKVLEEFRDVHIAEMDRHPARFMVLLIDFDGQPDRWTYAKGYIPERLGERVFILGVWTEPEDMKGSLETIGTTLAKDCRDGTSIMWDHELLQHNEPEFARLREHVRPFLF